MKEDMVTFNIPEQIFTENVKIIPKYLTSTPKLS